MKNQNPKNPILISIIKTKVSGALKRTSKLKTIQPIEGIDLHIKFKGLKIPGVKFKNDIDFTMEDKNLFEKFRAIGLTVEDVL